MLSTFLDPAQHQISNLHLLEQEFRAVSNGSTLPVRAPDLHSLLGKGSNGLLISASVSQLQPAQPHRHHYDILDNFELQSLPSLMSPDPLLRDRSESIDGREEEDEDEEMDEYEIFTLPVQHVESPINKPMTPLQLLNSSRPVVLASAYTVEQPHLRSQYQSSQQCPHRSISAPTVGFHALYPQLQVEHQLPQQSTCAPPVYPLHNVGQFFSPGVQFQPLQLQHTSLYSSSHSSTFPFGSHEFSNHAQHSSEAYSAQLLNTSELGVQQQHLDLDARPAPQNTLPSPEQNLDILMIPQFAENLSCSDLLIASAAPSLTLSPSLSWASATPSRDSSPSPSKEHVAIVDNTGKRTAARPSKRRSGSTHSRHGSKVSRMKSLPLLVESSASAPSASTGDSTAAPSESTEGSAPSTHYQSPPNAEVPRKRRRRMRQVRIKVKPTSFACDAPGCGKIFSRAYNLTSHMKTHSDERPFVCGSCPLAFARRHDCERHVRLHTGEKPYTCESCGCGFMRNDALHRHQRICGQSTSALLALLQQQQQRQENATGYI